MQVRVSTINRPTRLSGGLVEAAAGDGPGAQAQPAGHARRLGVEGDGVLVREDADLFQGRLSLLTRDVHGSQVNQHQVVVGTAGYQTQAGFGDGVGLWRGC